MPTNEMREFITGLIASLTEKLGDLDAPEECALPKNEVTIWAPGEDERRVNLDAVALGTVIRINLAEYMLRTGRRWIKYTGEEFSMTGFVELIRDEQESGADVSLVHFG